MGRGSWGHWRGNGEEGARAGTEGVGAERGREGGSESWEEVVVFAVLEGCEYWIQFVCVA